MSTDHRTRRGSGGAAPPGGGTDAVAPLLLIAVLGGAVAFTGAVWLAGRTASWLSGHGWAGPAMGADLARRFTTDGPKSCWPTVPTPLIWTALLLLLTAALAPLVAVWCWWNSRRHDSGGLARRDRLNGLTGPAAVARARQLRPALSRQAEQPSQRPLPGDVGVPLGVIPHGRRGVTVRASWEDTVLAVMAPRAGKTTALAIPAVLDAPGPVVATSNKPDLWAATATLRAQDTGEAVWVFDPQQVVRAPRTWWWDPLSGVTSVGAAHRLAGHFLVEIRRGASHDDGFWAAAAHDLLTNLLLAAALSGRGVGAVWEWLNDPAAPAPADLLSAHGHPAAAASVRGRQNGAPETRDGIHEYARTAAACLRDPQITAWITPTPDLPSFDPAAFVASRQTLHLLSRDGTATAAPLVAALADRIAQEGLEAALAAGGRLDPPLLLVLDEAANIARIADLPDLYSHLGSRGIVPVTILQSYRQGERVWGPDGMAALWNAATVKLVGAGIDDPRLLTDLSKMIGEHDVPLRTRSHSRDGTTVQHTWRRQPVLPPDAIRALSKGTALLLTTGNPPALINLAPWHSGPQRDRINTAAETAKNQLTTRATASREAGNAS
jgi:type IV secretory pathway TraG/TraD family ATPase VirD4